MIDINAAVSRISEDVDKALLLFYAFTGCGSTSAFAGKGKIRPLRLLQKIVRYAQSFGCLGTSSALSSDLCEELEALTCMIDRVKSGA